MEEEYKNLIKEEEKRKIDNFIDFHKNVILIFKSLLNYQNLKLL